MRGDTEARRDDWKWKLLLALILVVAARLRFEGIGWGLPDLMKGYSYHPDEFLTVGSALGILRKGLPGFYNYPSLYLYLSAFAVFIGTKTGIVPDPYLCARIVTALMGTGAVAATFWAGRVMFGTAVGLVAAAVLAIAPLHVQHSHFATVDVPSTLFVALTLGFAGMVLKRGASKDYALTGVLGGLAGATKYNAAMVLHSVIGAHVIRRHTRAEGGHSRIELLKSLGWAVLAFCIATPGVLLEWHIFRGGLGYELKHAAEGHGLVFAGTSGGFAHTLMSSLWYGLGPAFTLMLAAAVVYAIYRREWNAIIILAFALPYYILISTAHVRFARYALPLFPAAALLIGWLMIEVRGRLRKRDARMLWVSLCALGVGLTLGCTIAVDALFVRPDPRDEAARWVRANVPKRSSIGFVEVPWFYGPPLSRDLGTVHLLNQPNRPPFMSALAKVIAETPYRLYVFGQEAPGFARVRSNARPEWVVVSDFELDDALRLRGSRSLTPGQKRERDRILAAYDFIQEHYEKEETFHNSLGECALLPSNTRALPHDMRYPSPTVTVYRLKK